MSSEMPQSTKNEQKNMTGEDGWLHRKQHPDSSLLVSPRQQKKSAEHAGEFARKHEPRDMPIKSNRVNIQPDTEDEDNDFMPANERGTDDGIHQKMASEPDEKALIHNGSVPIAEAYTASEKESNIFQRTEPGKTSGGIKYTVASSQVGDPSPKKPTEPTSIAEAETTPLVVLEPLSEEAPKTHNKEILAKENHVASVRESQIEATNERNISPLNLLKSDPEGEPDRSVVPEASPDEGYFGLINIKHDQEIERDDNDDETFTGIGSIDAVLDSSCPKSKPASSRMVSGYMDYLRHPGGRHGSWGTMTGTNLGSQGHAVGELDQEQWPRHEDPHCDART
jgi:hypothetical protein